jgi:hypothetical protein
MREKTGGAAFPTPRFMVDDESRILGFSINTDGMSLRDYFAAKAMQGFAAYIGPSMTFESRAKIAYEWADAMLKAREE